MLDSRVCLLFTALPLAVAFQRHQVPGADLKAGPLGNTTEQAGSDSSSGTFDEEVIWDTDVVDLWATMLAGTSRLGEAAVGNVSGNTSENSTDNGTEASPDGQAPPPDAQFGLEGSLCSVVVNGSQKDRFQKYMEKVLDPTGIAESGISKLEELCKNKDMMDLEKLIRLNEHLRRKGNNKTWHEHTKPNKGVATAEMLKRTLPWQPKRVLDYGAGDCQDVAAVRQHFGIDQKDALGIEVREAAPMCENVSYVMLKEPFRKSVRKLALSEAEVDASWSFSVLHHVSGPGELAEVLGMLYQTLKGNGTFLLEEWALPEEESKQSDAAAWYDWVHMLNGAVFVTGKEEPLPEKEAPLPNKPPPVTSIGTRYYSFSQWVGAAEAAGFQLDAARSTTAGGGVTPMEQAGKSFLGGFVAVFHKGAEEIAGTEVQPATAEDAAH